jgi:FKBP-type peptidyl-prolyl cis-trans isomerase
VTASGLQFRTVKSGAGDPIGHSDAAVMDYILSADDGTVIDSSETHGGPQPFAMDQVFPGFAEAMTRMQEGGEYRFSMPQKLAFGDSPPPPGFPKNSKLNFEVRVRKIVRGGAALMQQMQQQQQAAQQQQQQPQQGLQQ